MILVTVEILPHGEQEGRRVLGRGTISNVGGTDELGEYIATFREDDKGIQPIDARLAHNRRESVWVLLRKALEQAHEK